MRKVFFFLTIQLFWLFACVQPKAEDVATGMSPAEFINGTVTFFLMALLVYYWLVLKPQTTRRDAQKKLLAELKKNDEVVTSGGIFGRVVNVKPEYITLEVSQNVKLKIKPEHVHPVKSESAQAKGVEKETSPKKKVAKGT